MAGSGTLASELSAGGQSLRHLLRWRGCADLQSQLPGFAELLKTLQSNIGAQRYSLDKTELTRSKNVSTATISVDGWPSELCNGKWAPGANAAYGVDADVAPAGQKCAITFRISLSGPNAAGATADDVANPGLYLQYKDDSQLRITFEPQVKPHLLGDTHMDLDTSGSGWSTSPASAPTPGAIDYLEWDLTGNVIAPDKTKQLTAISLNPGNFSCTDASGASLPFTTVGFPQSGSSDLRSSLQVAAGAGPLKLAARLDPKQFPHHDSDANQDAKTHCTVTGSVIVTLTDTTTNTSFDQPLTITAKHPVEFPGQIVDVLPAPVVNASTPAAGQVILTWKKVDGAKSYNVYRADIKGNEDYTVPVNKTPINTLAYADSTGTPNTSYFYTVTAYNALAKPGTPSDEAQATPKAAPKAPNAPVLQYSLNGDKTAVTLSWTTVDGAVYDLHRVDFRNHQNDVVVQSHVAATTVTDAIADPDAVVQYYVVAFVGAGASPSSNAQLVVPKS